MLKLLFLNYFILINIINFIFFGIDKYKAIYNKKRISEKKILISTCLWWILGWIFWMILFRHKTIKSSFQIKFWIIVFVWIVIFFLYFYKQN